MSELFTIESPSGAPTLADAAARLHVPVTSLDHAFGVVLIDPRRHLYAVNVATDQGGQAGPGVSGPFANPRIDAFGPPRDR